MSEQSVGTTVWAQVEGRWNRYWPDTLVAIKVSKITQRRPRYPEPGCVLVKLRITLPKAAFVPGVFEGNVEVDWASLEQVPATVEALPHD